MPSEPPETWGKWLVPQQPSTAADTPETPAGAEQSPEPMSEQDTPRDSRRVPIARRIQVKFDRFSGFIDEYVANVSPGGIFIRTQMPEAPGQELEFEFRLGDGFELIRGRGEVAWNRVADEGPSRPAGMGIRFIELSAGGKDLIYRIVDDYAARGGIPFDVARDPTMPAPAPPPPVFGTPAAAPAAAAAAASAATSPTPAAAAAAATPAAVAAAATGATPATAATAATTPPPATVTLGTGHAAPAAEAAAPLPSVAAPGTSAPLPAVNKPDASFADVAAELARIAGSPGPPPAPRLPNAGMTPDEQFALSSLLAPAGKAEKADPLQGLAASPPPLDELTTEAPRMPPPFASLGAPAAGRASSHRARWVVVGALVLLAAGGVLFRDSIQDWMLGKEPAAPATAAAVPPAHTLTGGAQVRRAPQAFPQPPAPNAASTPAPAGTLSSTPPRAGAPVPTRPAGPAAGSAAPAAALATAVPGAAAQGAAGPPATVVEKITWEPAQGGVEVILWGNGTFRPALVDHARLTRPVREVFRISGISQPFAATQLRVGSPELLQIRTGFHNERGSSQLHVVLDLGGPEVMVTGVEPREKQLRIHLRAR
jgi:uncharacterized protein (TIGR02266 family)